MHQDNEEILEISKKLVDIGYFDQAQVIIEPISCAMACFLKGRVS